MDTNEPLLRVRELAVSFAAVNVLRDISFDVAAGTVVSLIGPNGAGKTTVLNGIEGRVPAGGSILYGDRELVGVAPGRHARLGIVRTFQNPGLGITRTLAENVLSGENQGARGNALLGVLGLPPRRGKRASPEWVSEILKLLELRQYAHRPLHELPLATQKLAAVARAMAVRPRLLLLDEPASGLNADEAAVLGRAIDMISRTTGGAVLLVDHTMSLVGTVSDWVVALDEGRIVAQGATSVMMTHPLVLQSYGVQRTQGT